MVAPSMTPVVCGSKPSATQIGGYRTIASVASALTPTTTKTTSASLPGYSGTTAEVASVAEAPHTAVPTPASAPNGEGRPSARAARKPVTMVTTIEMTTTTPVPR